MKIQFTPVVQSTVDVKFVGRINPLTLLAYRQTTLSTNDTISGTVTLGVDELGAEILGALLSSPHLENGKPKMDVQFDIDHPFDSSTVAEKIRDVLKDRAVEVIEENRLLNISISRIPDYKSFISKEAQKLAVISDELVSELKPFLDKLNLLFDRKDKSRDDINELYSLYEQIDNIYDHFSGNVGVAFGNITDAIPEVKWLLDVNEPNYSLGPNPLFRHNNIAKMVFVELFGDEESVDVFEIIAMYTRRKCLHDEVTEAVPWLVSEAKKKYKNIIDSFNQLQNHIERENWIATHGSPDLLEIKGTMYNITRMYREERINYLTQQLITAVIRISDSSERLPPNASPLKVVVDWSNSLSKEEKASPSIKYVRLELLANSIFHDTLTKIVYEKDFKQKGNDLGTAEGLLMHESFPGCPNLYFILDNSVTLKQVTMPKVVKPSLSLV